MRRTRAVTLAAAFLFTTALGGGAAAAAQERPADDGALTQAIAKDYDYLRDLYTHFHRHPELSYQEQKTAKRYAKELKKLGFDVTEKVGAYAKRPDLTAYGVVAVMENGDGPTVMLRADMDGLPIEEKTGVAYASTDQQVEQTGETVHVMHACAHDTHMTMAIGAARRLVDMKDQWQGTLVVIGQPAEERIAGAKAMLEDGLFERFPQPDYNVALHTSGSAPAGHLVYAKGPALASSDSVDIVVHGVGAHGAYPHQGRDPIVVAAHIVTALQTIVARETDPLDSAVVTVGRITGGTKHNIIPEEVELNLTVRTFDPAVRDRVLASIERIAHNTARALGVKEDQLPEVNLHGESVGPTVNDPELTDRLAKLFAARFGADRVHQRDPVMGAEDFSHYGNTPEDIPSVMFWLGGTPPEAIRAAEAKGESVPSNHSPYFAPDPEPTLTTGVEALTAAVLELMPAESGGEGSSTGQ
ncbi:hippurate hydrolase [Rhodothalassium salexigens DSM 2132]|uniref:Hippurate hydrolase n=1 Tax=Rhodothalassium salexigens DSM 2132 TaxID=1188247 RepID=A0A4R2PRQ9_RHOSA|nr:amidohydrolase [Rhodothalassium salexigens]MBB4210837.1 hippurate hydrolase [Rhodothalassium salexigens DSM 2132]MBK1640131.1 hypothetical protein [Rhodothalassium salexigens DSM 2132]TCP37608.1 hippurate hydrolase [Rhodothalassium salexigens DSM 2132]